MNSSSGVKAFAVQYISIILIILTFIVGAFSSRIGASAGNNPDKVILAAEPVLNHGPGPVVGEFNIAQIFSPGLAKVDETKTHGLSEFLLNHDLQAQVQVTSDSAESIGLEATNQNMGLALARSVALYRHLLTRGVPANALEIWAGLGQSEDGIAVRIRQEQG